MYVAQSWYHCPLEICIREDQRNIHLYRKGSTMLGSFVDEGDFSEDAFKAMAGSWVDIEDNPALIDAEINELVENLNPAYRRRRQTGR